MEQKEYSKTVNLPVTAFSMKAGLVQKEPEYLKKWEKDRIYERQIEKRKSSPQFILHDGPPYANGEIHLGHALNKILKDIIIKYKYFRGYQTPYIPGWDCHGLPIELKVMEKLGEKAESLPKTAIRNECRKYADKFIKVQMEGFKRLGIFGEWNNPYLTMSGDYESAIISAFGKLVEKGYIYRGLRPVHWCISCNTSLAEAEIEYHDHSSPSVYVKFPVVKHAINKLQDKLLFALIWTTTPWTLPANTGLSFHPQESYVAAKIEGEYLIVAKELLNSVLAAKKLEVSDVVELSKADLESLSVRHAWIDRESKVVFGMHVTMDTGTGIVHTAPGHGMEDFIIGREYHLEMLSPVDDKGRFTSDVPEFEGLEVFDANKKIIAFLKDKNLLYAGETISHSYPHCWRCKNPIIFRSKPQWFFKVSDDKLSKIALGELSKIRWVPEWGEQRIRNMLTGRPDWCLSRQRNWGVPIPAFYCEDCGEALLNKETIDHIINIVNSEGIDVWYKKEAAELLSEGAKCPKCGKKSFKKETDILDVWFDSGVSHLAVLDKRDNLKSPAELYLEGNDQYRGWFQASLWPSVAIKGHAPYKGIITHGWVLDEHGKQMHKSLGNSVSPKEIYDKYGADVLRLWVVTEDYRGDLRIGDNLVNKAAEAYRKLRNTFRYLLGNLSGFHKDKALAYDKLFDIDKHALHRLAELEETVVKTYDNYEFYKGFREIYNFCAVDMSSFYLDILKDRLYIYPKDSIERLSAQTAMHSILLHLMTMLAPILPFTMEEIYREFFSKCEDDSIHLTDWIKPEKEWNNPALGEKFEAMKAIRDVALKALEIARTATDGSAIGSGLEAKVLISPKTDTTKKLLMEYKDQLRYFLIVSSVDIVDNLQNPTAEDDSVMVAVEKAKGQKCARCWNYNEKTNPETELCERCAPIVAGLSK